MRSAPPISIASLLDEAVRTLAASSDSPRLDVEVLLAHAMKRPRSYLRAWPEKPPSAAQARAFADFVARRAEGAPIAYLTGVREFFSLPLEVSPAVLIPRPETELLVELALERTPSAAEWRVLDAGTGSGAIALAIARERPQCRIIATDISAQALAVAKRNVDKLRIDTVELVRANWLSPFREQSFDIIASNPPYVRDKDLHCACGDVRAEPRIALAAGVYGLDAIRIIVREAKRCLLPHGWLILEHGHDQGEPVADILRRGGFRNLEASHDLGGRERVACGQR